MKTLKYQPCGPMAPSSELCQGLHSQLCAPCRALNTNPCPTHLWVFNIFLIPNHSVELPFSIDGVVKQLGKLFTAKAWFPKV